MQNAQFETVNKPKMHSALLAVAMFCSLFFFISLAAILSVIVDTKSTFILIIFTAAWVGFCFWLYKWNKNNPVIVYKSIDELSPILEEDTINPVQIKVYKFGNIDLPISINGITLNILAFIKYVDAEGDLSERKITLNCIYVNDDQTAYLETYCHLRKEERTFKLSRIKEFVDLDTGELISDFSGYILDKIKNNRIVKRSKL